MKDRNTRPPTGRQRRAQAKRTAQRRRLFKRMSWVAGITVVLVGVVTGGIFYANSQTTALTSSSSSATSGRDVGSRTGNYVPEFDLRLVNGSTVNSTQLVNSEKPAFYFFFATW